MFREMANALGFALAHRDVAQHGAELVKSVGALPAGETRLDRERLAIATASVELDHGARGEFGGVPDREWRCGGRFVAGANRIEGLADHLFGLVAEDRRRTRIPVRDQVVGIS